MQAAYYSNVFDYVEVDSSFYKIPNAFMVNNWATKTPKHFKFTAKFPKIITNEKRLKNVHRELVDMQQWADSIKSVQQDAHNCCRYSY